MAEGFGDHGGGISGLLDLIDHGRNGRALEADLIKLGLRSRWVGEEWFTWRDLQVIVSESGRNSALFRAMHPKLYSWDDTALLLASAVDALNWLVWSKTKDGKKNRNHPKPIPRPGVEEKAKRTKGVALPLDQFKKQLNLLRARVMHGGKEQ